MATAALEALQPGLSKSFEASELQRLTKAGFLSAEDFRGACEKDLKPLIRIARLINLRGFLSQGKKGNLFCPKFEQISHLTSIGG